MVELNEGFVDERAQPRREGRAARAGRRRGRARPLRQPDAARRRAGSPRRQAARESRSGGGSTAGAPGAGRPPLGDQADGVQRAGQILGAATGARWPMYLRNVKQILRRPRAASTSAATASAA